MGRTPLADGPSADSPAGAGAGSAEGVRLRASPSGFRPPLLVHGLFWFRARVILLPDGPTRPIPRLPVRGKVPPFPHPEPPLLLVLLGVAPSSGSSRGLSLVTAGNRSVEGVYRFAGTDGGGDRSFCRYVGGLKASKSRLDPRRNPAQNGGTRWLSVIVPIVNI
jgi:hypothetical protein